MPRNQQNSYPSSRYLRVPFVFVPHGAPTPREWLAEHPGAVRFSATFRPHARPAVAEANTIQRCLPENGPPKTQAPGAAPRPDRLRLAAPSPVPAAPHPPQLGPIHAEEPGKALGMRLSTQAGRAALLAETQQIRRCLERFSHPGIEKSQNLNLHRPPAQLWRPA